MPASKAQSAPAHPHPPFLSVRMSAPSGRQSPDQLHAAPARFPLPFHESAKQPFSDPPPSKRGRPRRTRAELHYPCYRPPQRKVPCPKQPATSHRESVPSACSHCRVPDRSPFRNARPVRRGCVPQAQEACTVQTGRHGACAHAYRPHSLPCHGPGPRNPY